LAGLGLAKACATCLAVVALAVLAATATLFGFGWIVVALGGATLLAVLASWPRLGPAWALLPLAGIALPAVAVAGIGTELSTNVGHVTVAPRALQPGGVATFRAGLGTLLVDLRHTELPATGTLNVRVQGGVRRTIVALPHDRCVHVELTYSVQPFWSQVASLVAGHGPASGVVVFGDYLPGRSGAREVTSRAPGPVLKLHVSSAGGSVFVRDYPDTVVPDDVPNWPGYPVHPEPRPDVRGLPKRQGAPPAALVADTTRRGCPRSERARRQHGRAVRRGCGAVRMSTTAFGGAMRRRLTDRSWQLTSAAGVLALSAMAIALGHGPVSLAVFLATGALLFGAFVLAPGALRAARGRRGWIAFSVLLCLVVLLGGLWIARATTATPGSVAASLLPAGWVRLLPLVAILAAPAAGMVLIADAVRIWLGLAPRQRAPWKQMTETRHGQGGIVWRVLAGVTLVGWAAFLAYSVIPVRLADRPLLELIALLLMAGGAGLVLGIPVAIGAFLRLGRDKAGTAHDRERQRFAAHLHDSVLQTLALVQRQAHDPVAVARMARRQEHALRAWMAGEAELVSDTLPVTPAERRCSCSVRSRPTAGSSCSSATKARASIPLPCRRSAAASATRSSGGWRSPVVRPRSSRSVAREPR
jgi:signal transduction histidine kinase